MPAADAGVVAVGVHVPAGVLHGDEAAARLDQPAGQQHLLAERRGLKELLADAELAGVVALDSAAVFLA